MIGMASTIRLALFGVGFWIHSYLVILLLRDQYRTASATVFLWINVVESLFHLTEVVRELPVVTLGSTNMTSHQLAYVLMHGCLALLSPLLLHFLIRERHERKAIWGYRSILVFVYIQSSLLALVVTLAGMDLLGSVGRALARKPLTLYNFYLFLPALLIAGASILRHSSFKPNRLQAKLWAGMLVSFVAMAIVFYAAWIAGFSGRFPQAGWWLSLIGETSSIPIGLLFGFYLYRFPFLDVVVRRGIALLVTTAAVILFHTSIAAALTRSIGPFAAAWTSALVAAGVWTLVSRAVRDLLFGRRSLLELGAEAQLLLRQRLPADELIDQLLALLRSHLKVERALFRSPDPLSAKLPSGGWIRKLTQDPEIGQAMDQADVELVLPIWARNQLWGTLWLGQRRQRQGYFTDDLQMLQTVCDQVGTVIENQLLDRERQQQLSREYQLRELAARAELRALRSQIQPHFLFNALNTVAGLIRENPPVAEEVVENLSETFRYALESTRTDRVTLREEIEFVQSYLQVEKARFEERLQVSVSVPPECAETELPAMTLQPIVENAVRHGVGSLRRGGRIAIFARRIDAAVEISVEDNGVGFKSSTSALPGHGIGLENVRARLQLVCGPKSEVLVRSEPGRGTTVCIKIPQ